MQPRQQQQSAFERSGGFVYIRNFFSPRDYEMLLDECEDLKAGVGAERRACARQRLGMMVPPDHFVHRRGQKIKIKNLFINISRAPTTTTP